jgi:hypothetical protein
MPKSGLARGARRQQGWLSAELSTSIEGQIAELCRDLAIEAKRLRQMQEQAEQLRIAIRQWVSDSEPAKPEREPVSRAARR